MMLCYKVKLQREEGLRVGDAGRWGGGKWWWENGDNCTCTTIKKKENKVKFLTAQNKGKLPGVGAMHFF